MTIATPTRQLVEACRAIARILPDLPEPARSAFLPGWDHRLVVSDLVEHWHRKADAIEATLEQK